jgi:hypothetical protein
VVHILYMYCVHEFSICCDTSREMLFSANVECLHMINKDSVVLAENVHESLAIVECPKSLQKPPLE